MPDNAHSPTATPSPSFVATPDGHVRQLFADDSPEKAPPPSRGHHLASDAKAVDWDVESIGSASDLSLFDVSKVTDGIVAFAKVSHMDPRAFFKTVMADQTLAGFSGITSMDDAMGVNHELERRVALADEAAAIAATREAERLVALADEAAVIAATRAAALDRATAVEAARLAVEAARLATAHAADVTQAAEAMEAHLAADALLSSSNAAAALAAEVSDAHVPLYSAYTAGFVDGSGFQVQGQLPVPRPAAVAPMTPQQSQHAASPSSFSPQTPQQLSLDVASVLAAAAQVSTLAVSAPAVSALPVVSLPAVAAVTAASSAAGAVAADPAGGADIEESELTKLNSTTQRNSYMRMLGKLKSAKAARDYPQLVARFNDKAKRAELFVDFFTAGENLDQVVLIHRRRQVNSQHAELKFRPKTKAELLARYDTEYVQLLINDAITKKRWKKDPLCPDDQLKWKYWVLDDETMTFGQLLEIENILEGAVEVEGEAVKGLTADGAFFSSNQALGTCGFNSAEAARQQDHFAACTQAAAGKAASKAASKNPPPEAKAAASGSGGLPIAAALGEGGPPDDKSIKPELPWKLALSAAKSLAKTSGECTEMLLKLQFCRASATLIAQLTSASVSLQQQYQAVQAFADSKCTDMPAYIPYQVATEAIVAYYTDVKSYANALVNTHKKNSAAKA